MYFIYITYVFVCIYTYVCVHLNNYIYTTSVLTMFCKGVHVLLHICNILFCLNLGEDWKHASKQKMCTNDYQMKLWQQTHPSTNIKNMAKSHNKKCATTVDHIWTTSRATRNQNIRVAAMQHPATLPLRLSYLNQKRNDVFCKEL